MNLVSILKPAQIALLFLAAGLTCASCASSPATRPETGAPTSAGTDAMGPPEPYGPPAPVGSDLPGTATAYGPEPVQFRSIVLVLGPGAARGFAYAGVIRALADAKIPVAAILGSEMGALIGAIYAIDGKVNHFEWGMLKLKEDIVNPPTSMLPKLFKSSAKRPKLEKELNGIFANRDLNQTKIPFRVAMPPESKVIDRGPLVRVLLDGLDLPASSYAQTEAALITEARAMNLGSVVAVSMNEGGGGGADLIVHPDLKDLSENDFNKKTEASFRGKQAIEKSLPEIRHLVGLPEVPAA
jgi:hypothetical protein